MSKRSSREETMKYEIIRCILLSDEDKKFWVEHAASLPDVLLEKVIKLVEDKNKQVDTYLIAAFAEDPQHKYLAELKEKIKQIKEKAFALEEGEEKESVEDILKKQLEQL